MVRPLTLAVLACAACDGPVRDPAPPAEVRQAAPQVVVVELNAPLGLYRVDDDARGTTCYVVHKWQGTLSTAISCQRTVKP